MVPDLKDTLLLPRTEFPMRAGLPTREPLRIAHWKRLDVYGKRQRRRAGAQAYVLHDGPPFTNGDVHLGTALNKVMKDAILRYRSMRGDRTPYVPGWDCHGLPIEFKVAKLLQAEGKPLDPVTVREACARFSRGYIETQRAQFVRLGVDADWASEYRTLDPAYEADILRTFGAFVREGLVYRSHKPVLWSIPAQTALAEAEIEYKDHVSDSVWVAFPLDGAALAKLGLAEPAAAVIWTTTPWTLPANLAIAVHPELEYVAVRAPGGAGLVVVARARLDAFREAVPGAGADVVARWKGQDLEGLAASHPFIDRASPLVLADYVTTDSGSGLVHTAPGHGLEDYHTGLKYGLETYCPVADDGTFVDDGRVPAALVGLSLIGKDGSNPANRGVLGLLRERGALLAHSRFRHSYPYCWRSKTPVAYRALPQWFVSLDRGGVRDRVLDAIGTVAWIPAWGENRIRGAVAARPDWCVSRQRAWGVPIPAFYHPDGTALLTPELIEHVAGFVARHGTDGWWKASAAEILAGFALPAGWDAATLRKEKDTLDVWFDSGSSHRAVLKRHPDLHWPADLYLEGSDQHRGWFQSSLWTSVVAERAAPFRKVVTHGFIVDLDGQKISKSADKPMTADAFVKQWGADVVRLYVSAEDYRSDITLSEEIFGHVAASYRLIRNTLRFQVSNLFDFDPARDLVPRAERLPLERWLGRETDRVLREVTAAYEALEFHKVYQALNRFCANTLSATAHDILKDRLYTYPAGSHARRSAQSAIAETLDVLCRMLAPILAFTADEAWSYARGAEYVEDSVHLQDWPVAPAADAADEDADAIVAALRVRESVNEALARLRADKRIGQSLEAGVVLAADPASPEGSALARLQPHLAELFIVSRVDLRAGAAGSAVSVDAEPLGGERCPRCWRHVPLSSHPACVCPRCAEALSPS